MILMLGLLSLKDLKSIWVEISGIEMGGGSKDMSGAGHGKNNQKSCRYSYLESSDCARSYSELETEVCTTHLHTNVHRNFIHSCQNLDAIKMSFSKWMDKLWYISRQWDIIQHRKEMD